MIEIFSTTKPAVLKVLATILKIARVPLLLHIVSLGEYSAFIYFTFVHGLILAFEQTNSTNFVNTMSNKKEKAFFWNNITAFNQKFTILISFAGALLICFNVNVYRDLNLWSLSIILVCLFAANYL